jgi:hypothetical protein
MVQAAITKRASRVPVENYFVIALGNLLAFPRERAGGWGWWPRLDHTLDPQRLA